MTTPDTTQRLADAFAGELRAVLTPAELEAIRYRNATPGYSHACASHDFVDANVYMDDAFLATLGRHPRVLPDPSEATDAQYASAQLDEAADHALWNAAWDIAKREYLTAPVPAVAGIWTPWAAVLCYRDHAVQGPVTPEQVATLGWAPTAPGNDEGVTPCDTCGRPVVVRADVAAEHNLLPALRAAGLDAAMDQTGGMCSAVSVTLAGGAYVLIVDSEATEAYGERFHVIHYADDEVDSEGVQVGPDEGVPASEVVAAVTTLATLQRTRRAALRRPIHRG